jgi:hypothetical protein
MTTLPILLMTTLFQVLVLCHVVTISTARSSSRHTDKRNETLVAHTIHHTSPVVEEADDNDDNDHDYDDDKIHIVYATDEHVLSLTLISVTSIVHHAVNLSNIYIYFVLINTRYSTVYI